MKRKRIRFNTFLLVSIFFHLILFLAMVLTAKSKTETKVVIELQQPELTKQLNSSKSRKNPRKTKSVSTKKKSKKVISKKVTKSVSGEVTSTPGLKRSQKDYFSKKSDKRNRELNYNPLFLEKQDLRLESTPSRKPTDNFQSYKRSQDSAPVEGVTPEVFGRSERSPALRVSSSPNLDIGDEQNDLDYQQVKEDGKIAGDGQQKSELNWKGKGKRKLINRDVIRMPKKLINKGIKATVVLSFLVDAAGRPHKIQLHKSSGYTELDNEVKRYTRSFRFDRVDDSVVYEAEFIQYFMP